MQAIIVHQTRLVLGPVDALDVDPVLEHFPKRRHLSQSGKNDFGMSEGYFHPTENKLGFPIIR